MGHCSCYGPVDDIEFSGKDKNELYDSCSDGLKAEVQCLFDAVTEADQWPAIIIYALLVNYRMSGIGLM